MEESQFSSGLPDSPHIGVSEIVGDGVVAGLIGASAVGTGFYLRDWQRHPEDLAAATPR